jgi:hypothetical protein
VRRKAATFTLAPDAIEIARTLGQLHGVSASRVVELLLLGRVPCSCGAKCDACDAFGFVLDGGWL